MNNSQINIPHIHESVTAAFHRYEKALIENDIKTLDNMFWSDAKTVRFGATEELFGRNEILAFRKSRPSRGLNRVLGRTLITTFGETFATANTTFTRANQEYVGRQSHSWVWFGDHEGWKIVAAHVSTRGQ